MRPLRTKVARTLRLHGHAGKRILVDSDMHEGQTYQVPQGQEGSSFENLFGAEARIVSRVLIQIKGEKKSTGIRNIPYIINYRP